MMDKAVLIRADANAQIGAGHVMRCLALAEAWKDEGGMAIFITSSEDQNLRDRLKARGIEMVAISSEAGHWTDAKKTAEHAAKISASWVVLDGYHFKADYQKFLKDSGHRLLLIDDDGCANHYYADILLNQNVHAHEDLYTNKESYTKLLLGSRYVLLRHEFLKWKVWKRKIPQRAKKILITLGGGDPSNVTLKVIQALQKVAEKSRIEADVIVGMNNPHLGDLRSSLEGSFLPICLETNVKDMPTLMIGADMAVSAGGSTCWELAFMGVPDITIVLAENQRPIAESLHTLGASMNLGWHENLSIPQIAQSIQLLVGDESVRKQMREKGQGLIDGLGASRIVLELLKDLKEC